MKATETIELNGQSIKLLIEASKAAATSARKDKNSHREMQYIILAATLQDKLTKFHTESLAVLEKKVLQ